MFAFEVTMMSLFERSSERISTLPRIMPRSASETEVTSDGWLTGAAGWGVLRLRSRGPNGVVGAELADCAAVFGCLPSFSSSSLLFCTIASSAVLMSTAAALWIWRTNTFSVTGVSTSIIRAISRIRLMFASVSVMMIELVRSKTSSTPLADLKPSSAF